MLVRRLNRVYSFFLGLLLFLIIFIFVEGNVSNSVVASFNTIFFHRYFFNSIKRMVNTEEIDRFPSIVSRETVNVSHDFDIFKYSIMLENNASLVRYHSHFSPFNYDIVEMRNVGLSYSGAIVSNETVYKIKGACQEEFVTQGSIKATYRQVLASVISSSSVYGHFICDIIAPIVLIPRELRRDFHIILNYRPTFHREIAALIGINPSNIVILGAPDIIMGYSVYKFSPLPCDSRHIGVYALLREELWKAMDLKKMNATGYVVFNRSPRSVRYVKNINAVIEKAKSVYPQNWVLFASQNTFVSNSRYYNTIKMMISVSGSGNTNMLFMQPESVYLEVASNVIFHWITFLAAPCHVYFIRLQDKSIDHFRGHCEVNLSNVEILIKEGLQYNVP